MKSLNKKGQAVGMIGSVIGVITVVVLLFISILLVAKVKNSIDTNDFYVDPATNISAENDTFNDVVSNANTAFTLLGVALIVMVAFLIISILRG